MTAASKKVSASNSSSSEAMKTYYGKNQSNLKESYGITNLDYPHNDGNNIIIASNLYRDTVKSYEFIDPSPYDWYGYDYNITFDKWFVRNSIAGAEEQNNPKENCPFENKCGSVEAHYDSRLANPTGPSTPSLTSPSDGKTFHHGSPTLKWSVSSGSPPLMHILQVATSSSFSDIVAEKFVSGRRHGLFGREKKVNLPDYGTYYWRVKAYNTEYYVPESDWSEKRSFTYTPAPMSVSSILGPSELVEGKQGTWTVNVQGGYPPYNYDWDYMLYSDECSVLPPLPSSTNGVEPNDVDCNKWTDGSSSDSFSRSVNGDEWDLKIRLRVWHNRQDRSEATVRNQTVDITPVGGGS